MLVGQELLVPILLPPPVLSALVLTSKLLLVLLHVPRVVLVLSPMLVSLDVNAGILVLVLQLGLLPPTNVLARLISMVIPLLKLLLPIMLVLPAPLDPLLLLLVDKLLSLDVLVLMPRLLL